MDRAGDRRRLVIVALGGVAGSSLRWAILTTVEAGTFPWPVLAINVVGSFVLGAAMAEPSTRPGTDQLRRDGLGVGFCGGLTTFSTFAVEVVQLGRRDELGAALAYVAASLAGTLAAVVAGAAALRRVRALRSPVDGPP